ncbi:MAG: rhomboid family intramembrane serine protease [Planctomycetes bacterium]|nr:rhomboid family intramembrane serine protease [Planctomycetota bacterium]
MGLYDRQYTQDRYGSNASMGGSMGFGFPPLTRIVKILMMINGAVFLLQLFGADSKLVEYFSVWPITIGTTLQIWRFVTYQFLHGGMGHVIINMLVLYMFGGLLERLWGDRRFLRFYLVCGVAGGLMYPLLLWLNVLQPSIDGVVPLIGASGSILGILAACAILFPRLPVYVWGIFPIPLWIVAVVTMGIALATVWTRGPNAGGEAAHLGGMIAGGVYVYSDKYRHRLVGKFQKGRWERKITAQHATTQEIDSILQKVHRSGIHSLTHAEKRALKRATETEKTRKRT